MPSVTLNTSDLDEARALVREQFYPTDIDLVRPADQVTARLGVLRLGAVTIGDLQLGADVSMRFGELGAYHVDVPLSGSLAWRQGHRDTALATPRTAAVFQPTGDTVLERWTGDCRLLAVKIEPEAVRRRLARLTGAAVRTPPRLAPRLDMVDGPGASWARLIRLLAVGARDQAALAHHPLIGGQFEEAVVDGLLLATGHPYRDQLARPPAARPVPGAIRAAPRAIRIAVDALQAEPGRPWTAARLADVAGISLRSLQEGFHRHVGSPPMAYLRGVRLARAHEALTHADPDRTTVAAIAYRWGFAHLGRFAAVYRTRYGVMPSVTLRSRS